ncbi:hypothetical protein VTP01DRAFT_4132 [Rhizomucor pusillus]|uniref:uncharacterized protein n=1 Tax=Rhizomucor pusillus TaxID=4840 RepID=UPI0037432AE0
MEGRISFGLSGFVNIAKQGTAALDSNECYISWRFAAMPGPAKRSGLQQQVLNLYRACFRAARQKPAENRPRFYAYIRREFRAHPIRKNDFATIEYMLRRGQKQLETYGSPSIQDIHL